MALSLNRVAFRPAAGNSTPAAIWVAGGFGMLVFAACSRLAPETSLAIVPALLVLMVSLADLRAGFLLFVALCVFLPDVWGLDLADWMPYLTANRLCSIVLATTFLFQSKGVCDTPRVRKVAWFLVILATIQTLAGFASNDPLGAVKNTFEDIVEVYVPIIMASHLFRTKAQIRTLVLVLLSAMAVVAVLAIIEHATDHNLYSGFVAARDRIRWLQSINETVVGHRGSDRRARVAFGHSIELGLHLMCMLLLLACLLGQRRFAWRATALLSMPLFALALLYTYSRGPMLGLVCGLCWFAVVGRGTRLIAALILLGGLGAYLLMPGQSRHMLDETVTTTTDLQTGDSLGGGSVRSRLALLAVGLQLTQRNIWFGLGPTVLQHTQISVSEDYAVDFGTVDNFYLAVVLRHGIITLALVVGLFLYLLGLFSAAALKIQDREVALMAAIAASICLGYCVALATVGFNITIFWALVGPVLRLCDLYLPQVPRSSRRRGRGIARFTGFRPAPGVWNSPRPGKAIPLGHPISAHREGS